MNNADHHPAPLPGCSRNTCSVGQLTAGSEIWGPYAPAVARWEEVLGRKAPSATGDRGRLSTPFVEWMMGLSLGFVIAVPGLSRKAQLKALGNGVLPAQASAALQLLLMSAGRN
ncbi:hypothetical protein WKI65_43565 [Streptomyces sp. MS1.AVA.3]|uniref:hypothetical protein n=1 Tax=Streptomyces decoyicus TaxID=249567 RepID=UPI0030C07F3A